MNSNKSARKAQIIPSKSRLRTQIDNSQKKIYKWSTNIKKRSTSLMIREMQIKTTRRYHLTPARMAITKKFKKNGSWCGCAEQKTLLHCWWECKLVQPLQKTLWRFLKELKVQLPFDPAIPLLGIYSEEKKLCIVYYYTNKIIICYYTKRYLHTRL